MNRLRSFLSDQRGNATVKVAFGACALSFVAVLSAVSLDRAARDGSLSRYAQSVFGKGNVQTASNRPRQNGQFDYTPSGTVVEAARNVLLDPCLGMPKN